MDDIEDRFKDALRAIPPEFWVEFTRLCEQASEALSKKGRKTFKEKVQIRTARARNL